MIAPALRAVRIAAVTQRIYICIYIYVYTYVYMYICIYMSIYEDGIDSY
jgi:hypothetical protein